MRNSTVPSGSIGRAGVGIARRAAAHSRARPAAQLEPAQHRRLIAALRQARERGAVVGKKLRMRIFARQHLQQQLVEIEAAEQRRAGDQRQAAAPFGPGQRLDLVGARPRKGQRLERLQDAAQLRTRTFCAARHQRNAAVIRGERLDDEARLAVGMRMQHESRLIVAASAVASSDGAMTDARGCSTLDQYPNRFSIALVVGPAAFDANPDFEKDPAAEQALHVASRGAGDFFHSRRRRDPAAWRAGFLDRRRRWRECGEDRPHARRFRSRPWHGRAPRRRAGGRSFRG